MRNRRNRTRQNICRIAFAGVLSLIIVGIIILIGALFAKHNKGNTENVEVIESKTFEVVQDFLTPNRYSRPQKRLKNVKGIVVHYTANPGTDAKENRDYFDGLRISGATYASSHFVIGLDGTIIQCIPLDEISYASNDRNDDTVSIECCHKKKNGKFTKATYDSLVKLVAWLSVKFDVGEEDIIRHYDVTGKMCPLYYVKHEDKWTLFKQDVIKAKKDEL